MSDKSEGLQGNPTAPPEPEFCDDCPHTDGDASHLHNQAVAAMECALSYLHKGEYRNFAQWALKAVQFTASAVVQLNVKIERAVTEIEEAAKL